MAEKIKVSMVGCCLVDRLYNDISFSDSTMAPYLSQKQGDGGLNPGHLVFKEEFETYGKDDFHKILQIITRGRKPDKINIGGPGVVPIIHTSQLLDPADCECHFYGCGGNDDDGKYLKSTLLKMNLSSRNFMLKENETPSTIVLSDPNFDQGNGERIFINSIAAAWDYQPSELDDDFFSSDIVVFGGTALVPQIHDSLTELLEKAKAKNCITVVNTVFDFRNEKANPDKKWPLGASDNSYRDIDLLIVDYAEALRLSGKQTLDDAISFFKANGTGATIVTNGSRNISLYAENSSLFGDLPLTEMPVSAAVSEKLKQGIVGDTTGCGDNFVGGVLASIVMQIRAEKQPVSLEEACIWGIVSGGFSCFYIGGTYFEKQPGEKLELITPLYQDYCSQISDGN